MGEHRPTVTIECDVFVDEADLENGWTYEDVARLAWEDVQRWVRSGYLPVVTVTMPDETVATVDLEKVT